MPYSTIETSSLATRPTQQVQDIQDKYFERLRQKDNLRNEQIIENVCYSKNKKKFDKIVQKEIYKDLIPEENLNTSRDPPSDEGDVVIHQINNINLDLDVPQ